MDSSLVSVIISVVLFVAGTILIPLFRYIYINDKEKMEKIIQSWGDRINQIQHEQIEIKDNYIARFDDIKEMINHNYIKIMNEIHDMKISIEKIKDKLTE